MLCDQVGTYWIEKIPENVLEEWEEFWEQFDREEEEEEEDDDEYMSQSAPHPEHRRRRGEFI